MRTRISFIGFGEAASCLSRPLHEHGAELAAFDLLAEEDGGLAVLRRRAGGVEIAFCSLPDAVANADYVLSTVTTQAAPAVAGRCAKLLQPGQIFIDLNTTSPGVKAGMARTIGATGAGFVEGAILGAIGAAGAATRILLGGERAEEAAAVLSRMGLNVAFYSREIGRASTFKMLRSVFSKGLEALLLEFLIAAKRAGLEGDLWDDVRRFMSDKPFEKVAANWIQTHAVAWERRYFEMLQVAATLGELALEPVMTAATVEVFRRSGALGLGGAFAEKPSSMAAVVDFLEERLRKDGKGRSQ